MFLLRLPTHATDLEKVTISGLAVFANCPSCFFEFFSHTMKVNSLWFSVFSYVGFSWACVDVLALPMN